MRAHVLCAPSLQSRSALNYVFTMTMTMHRAASALIVLTSIALAACNSTTSEPRLDPSLCQQTYEFGNFGCSRVVANIIAPSQPWPARYRLSTWARPARPNSGQELGFRVVTAFGYSSHEYILLPGPLLPAGSDTLSVWLIGLMADEQTSAIFASDSMLRVLRFAGVGKRAPVDTIQLTLRAK